MTPTTAAVIAVKGAVNLRSSCVDSTKGPPAKIKINDGLKINVDINQLIEKIYIHPKSENWYKNLVIELVSKLGFDIEIEKSDLESDILI